MPELAVRSSPPAYVYVWRTLLESLGSPDGAPCRLLCMLSRARGSAGQAGKFLSGAVLLAPLLIYWLLPTRDVYWDGVAFAIQIEKAGADMGSLAHPNHLLYEVFGHWLFAASQSAGTFVRALFLLQFCNGFAAFLCAVLLYAIQRKTGAGAFHAACWALVFAFSGTWWKFATDADAYIIAILFLLAAYALMLGGKPRPAAVALAHTGGMLFHELAVFFFPAAIWRLYRQSSGSRARKIRVAGEYFALAALLTTAVYWYMFRRARLPDKRFWSWVTAYSPDARFSFNPLRNLALTLAGTVRLFFTGRADLVTTQPMEIAGLILLAAIGALLLIRFRSPRAAIYRFGSDPRRGKDLIPLVIWASSYVLFLFFWMPQNTFYRLFYLPPVVLLLGAAAPQREAPRPQLALAAAFVFLWNFTFSIYPRSRIESNPVLTFALKQKSAWRPGDGVAFLRFVPDLWTICYFNPQASWIGLLEASPAELDGWRERLGHDGGRLWLDETAFEALNGTAAGRSWIAQNIDFSGSIDSRLGKSRFRFYRVAAR